MRHILLAAFSMMLLAGISCSTVHSGNRMISFKPDRQSIRYRAPQDPTHRITAILKDDMDNPLSQISVELFTEPHLVEPLMITMTSPRGKFSFSVRDGMYVIVINHHRFNERKINISVTGGDIDLNEIRLSEFLD